MEADALYLVTVPGEAVALSNSPDELRYWKELIYEGDFVKQTAILDQKFSVSRALLDHWNRTFKEMKLAGVEIPVPKEHTTDPEARRGTLEDVKVERNAAGLWSLKGLIAFRDLEAAKLAKTTDVSLFVPEKDAQAGKTWYRPIQHCALTDYPVIKGLEKFQALACSLVTPIKEVRTMPFDPKKLAVKLGLAADIADDKLETEIDVAVNKLLARPESVPVPEPIAASTVTLTRKLRNSELDAMVKDEILIPASADALRTHFCDDKNIKLSLSLSSGAPKDEFEIMVEGLRKNGKRLTPTKEQTEPQVLRLSKDEILDNKKNPMLAAADRRAEAAK